MLRSVLILAGALLLGGGIVACGSDDDASDVPPGVTATLEASIEGINVYDTEAYGALLTEDFTWQSTGEVQSGPALLAHIDTYYEKLGFHVELTGPMTIERDGVMHGLGGWFECELAEGVWMTNSPLSERRNVPS